MGTEIEVRIKQDFLNLKAQNASPATAEEGVIFLNQLDNKVKYRAPQNGTVYNLLTSRYVSKNCVFQTPNDENGLFHWILTDYGAQPFLLQPLPIFNIYALNGLAVEPYTNIFQLINKNPSTFALDDTPFNAINIDFSFTEQFIPKGIFLRSPNVDTYGFLQNFTVYMLETGREDAICSFAFVNTDDLLGVNKTLYIPVENETRSTYKFAIIQTGVNSIGTHTLALGGIELYGKFL